MRAWRYVFWKWTVFSKNGWLGHSVSARGNFVDQYSDERRTRDGSTEPGDSAAGEAEISLINEAVTAVWSDFGVEADEKGKPRSPDHLKCRMRMQATKSQRRTVIFTARLYFY